MLKIINIYQGSVRPLLLLRSSLRFRLYFLCTMLIFSQYRVYLISATKLAGPSRAETVPVKSSQVPVLIPTVAVIFNSASLPITRWF